MKRFIAVFILIAAVNGSALDPRIVGGKLAKDGQFPHQVSLQINGQHSCGGSIIDEFWILTAAHCVYRMPRMTVVVGTNKWNSNGKTHAVDKALYHADYDTQTMQNDIGLVKVSSPILFNAKTHNIPLSVDEVGAGSRLTLSGWGLTSYPGIPSKDLLYIDLDSISNAQCAQSWPNFDNQLCTFNQKGQGSCQGDSGGPLIYNGNLVGVVSFGKPCAIGEPDVFTRVSEYIGWIETVMENDY